MSNLGFLRLRVVNPYEASFREARSAVGAAPLLARAEEYSSVAEAVADCSLVIGTTAAGNRELHLPLRLLKDAGPSIRKRLRAGGRVALLFGSEKRGLANEDLSHCHWVLHIPTREEHVSMNLGQAVAVCLYELVRGTAPERIVEAPAHVAASAEDLERLTLTLLEALDVSQYIKPGMQVATDEKIRRMVRRLNLHTVDVEVWLGVVRQMLWKMKLK